MFGVQSSGLFGQLTLIVEPVGLFLWVRADYAGGLWDLRGRVLGLGFRVLGLEASGSEV